MPMGQALIAWALLAAVQFPSQSVAEIARKARLQQARSAAVRIYTEDDVPRLQKLPINVIGELGEETSDAPSLSAIPKPDPEAFWRRRFAAAREDIVRLEREVSRLQEAFDTAVSRDWLWSDSESPGNVYICDRKLRKVILGRLGISKGAQICVQLNEQRDRLIAARVYLEDLPDELRRAGGYPRWGRH